MRVRVRCVILMFLQMVFGAKSTFFPSQPSVPDGEGICNLRVVIYGYGCEEHKVTTQDGYILSMQRIPRGRFDNSTGAKLPVLLQHGLTADGVTWVLSSPEESLAFILADNGYDVWIANTRGTKYSRGHTSLSSDDSVYWNWSWDELVSFELPANVQYVQKQTGQKVHYIGHSLGTLVALAYFSQHKQLDMFRSAALLSPIAYLGQVTSPLSRAAAQTFSAEQNLWRGINMFDPKGPASQQMLKTICANPIVNCLDMMSAVTGFNCCLNTTTIEVLLDNEPQPSSTKTMIHLSQMIRVGAIAKFDYGPIGNMDHYGQVLPPTYDMTSIPEDFPLYLSYGGADALSDVNDVQRLLDDLKDHDKDKLVAQYIKEYAHLDFIMATNAKQVLYDPIIEFIKLHS